MFDLLTPHLTAASRSAQFVHRLRFENEQMQTALECAKLAVVKIDRELNTQIESATAAKLLQKYFQNESAALSDELLRYIKHHRAIFINDEFYLPPMPLKKTFHGENLIILIITHYLELFQ